MLNNIIQQFKRRQASPFIQFIKYGITGVAQIFVATLVFSVAGWLFFPALHHDEWIVRFFRLSIPELTEQQRAMNFMVCNIISFFTAGYFGYIISIKWVFEPGRHPPFKELILFYGLAAVTTLGGTWLGAWTIRVYDNSGAVAFMIGTGVPVICNYLIRKFYIFKG